MVRAAKVLRSHERPIPKEGTILDRIEFQKEFFCTSQDVTRFTALGMPRHRNPENGRWVYCKEECQAWFRGEN